MQRLSERQLTDIHIFCSDLWHTKYERTMYVVCTEASMQVSIDIEALDTPLERVSSGGRLDNHPDADEMVVGVLTALVPLPIGDASNPGGMS
jgi:hypothetical protein